MSLEGGLRRNSCIQCSEPGANIHPATMREATARLAYEAASCSEKQAVVVLQPEQDPTGHLPGLERHDSMLVGGLHIAQSAIERVAGVYG